MTNFLVKHFVKDYERVEDSLVRNQYGYLASAVGIFCNMILFAVKLVIGVLLNSISITADAFNNLSDAVSSVIGFAAVKMAGKPADKDHPFGHGRIEYIAAFILAFIVIQVGFSFFKTSIGKIKNPQELTFELVPVLILLLSVGVKCWLAYFNRKLGNQIHSKVMIATAADALGDVLTTLATVASIVTFGVFGVNVDGIMGVVVSVIIMVAGINIAKDTLAPLIGEAIDPRIYREMTEFVEGFDGIEGAHDLIVHNYGPAKSMASIHAEVPSFWNMEEAHALIDQIEREAFHRFGILLVIHMDPVNTSDERIYGLREVLEEVLHGIDTRCTFHDLRLLECDGYLSLIFDLVVPREYKKEQQSELRDQVITQMREKASGCICVITVESGFCAEV